MTITVFPDSIAVQWWYITVFTCGWYCVMCSSTFKESDGSDKAKLPVVASDIQRFVPSRRKSKDCMVVCTPLDL